MEALTTSKTVSVKIYLPEETRAKFKASCAMRSLSMNEVLLEYIETWLQENEPVLEPKPQRVKTSAKTEETDC
ncbi:plasmid partition protein ParG [Microcoleus sp. OTE_8_concoct_300]|uniref:plasmid partition protein ParG n=1 Tax=Microcoleus sp. OTE_8_concoct_300 TaxID=2964710 RepID=UPI00403FAF2A